MTIQNKKGDVMNHGKTLALVILATAGLSGCATTRSEIAAADAVAPTTQVSRPVQSYGSMGGYRYRRFVTVTIASSS
jgi:uncharacterized protein YceK